MKTSTLVVLFALLLAAAPLRAQDLADPAPVKNSRLSMADLRLEFLRSDRAPQYFNSIQELYGRQIVVQDQGESRGVRNIMLLGDTILINDTEANIAMIKGGIEKIMKMADADQTADRALVRSHLEPRHISLSEAIDALGSLARRNTRQASIPQGFGGYENLTVLESRGIIMVQDTAANIAEMERIIALVDRPRPQVLIRCRIVQGSELGQDTDPRLQQLLPAEMKELTRFEHFRTLASGAIRTSAGAGTPVAMRMSGQDGISADLELRTGGFVTETGTLRLDRVELQFFRKLLNSPPGESQTLTTATTLPAGEVVVIGALGENPIFVILDLTVIDG